MTYISHYTSPLGPMTMASDGEALIGLWFDGQKYDRANINKVELVERDLPIFDQTKSWLDTYFSGQQPTFTPPLKLTGSDFRQRVLQQLMKIPYGHTTTYGEIAKIIAQERANNTSSGDMSLSRACRGAQAIGGAVGHNPISIIIPCHRVLGSNHTLTGYAGGLDRKLWLLTHEQKRGDSPTTVPGTVIEKNVEIFRTPVEVLRRAMERVMASDENFKREKALQNANDSIRQIEGLSKKTYHRMHLIAEYLAQHPASKCQDIADHIEVSSERTRIILVQLSNSNIVDIQGNARARTYTLHQM